MDSKTFIRTFLEDNTLNYKNNYKTETLYGGLFNSRFVNDQMIANKYIANSKISENEMDWNYANNIFEQSLSWKINTVYNVNTNLIEKDGKSILFWHQIEDKMIQDLLICIKDNFKINDILFSNDILLIFKRSLYYINFNNNLLVKFYESREFTNTMIEIAVLSVPWRLMMIYGEIGLQKTYMEAGEISFIIKSALNFCGIKYKEKKLYFYEEEERYGYSNIEKQIVERFEII
ncbi:hypothetical protein [Mammaliicoccus lentus]|uniref:hypothetical protein n=1 Tax=Mammaliicoccus lentus TaxID=42858 RepID=UPI001B340930|nr:hypothetical protein [Mammaliicoccus lentus]